VYFLFFVVTSVVTGSAVDCLESVVDEVTYCACSGTSNSMCIRSLTERLNSSAQKRRIEVVDYYSAGSAAGGVHIMHSAFLSATVTWRGQALLLSTRLLSWPIHLFKPFTVACT